MWKIVQSEETYQTIIITGEQKLDPDDDNVDVEVQFHNGTRYVATFFTLKNLQSLFDKNKRTGECAAGLYFYTPDMIVVEKLTPEVIRETICNLIQEGVFTSAFLQVE